MEPELLLRIVAALAGYAMKTAVAFGICLVLHRLAHSPNRRFIVWAGFLYGAAGYWLWLAAGLLKGGPLPAEAAPQASAQTPASAAGFFEIPNSWAGPLGSALGVMGVVYLLVVSYIFFSHLKKQRQLRSVLGFTWPPPAEIAEIFDPLAESFHTGRSRLRILAGATSPATFGWIRPTVLLPEICLEQERSELEDILRHELHHIRRRDFAWNGFAIACRALLFFHPAAWYALGKMQLERELACDLAVVSGSPGRRANYAECLLHFARLSSFEEAKSWGIDFASSSGQLQARVHSILAGSKKPSTWMAVLRTACALIVLAGFFGIEPTLAVPFSYAQRQISQTLTTDLPTTHPGIETRLVRARTKEQTPGTRVRVGHNRAVIQADKIQADKIQADKIQADNAPSVPDSSLEGETGLASSQASVSDPQPGPKLVHRPASGSDATSAAGTKQESVSLLNPDGSGEVGKSADRKSKETFQQTATSAAAIYKQLSALDRH